MQHCGFCQVDVAGNKARCPLCGSPLQGQGSADTEVFPQIRTSCASISLLRVLALVAISISLICVLVNIATGTQIWWSLFVAAGLLCNYLLVSVAVSYRRDPIQNIGWQVVLMSLLSVLWDWATGWLGWSLDFVLPCVCIAGLVVVITVAVLLRLPLRAVASVLSGTCLLGILPGFLAGLGVVGILLPSLICTGVSGIVLAALLIFRWAVIRSEFSRRFHL